MIGLPGFDAWLTTPPDDGPEPREYDYDDARAELGPDATDDEVDALAWEIMQRRIDDAQADYDDHRAQSREDDEDRRYDP